MESRPSSRGDLALERLSGFFAAIRGKATNPESGHAAGVARFLAEYRRLRELSASTPRAIAPRPVLDAERFSAFAAAFSRLHEDARRAGSFIDLWRIAGLRRNEIRNSAVLAWLLDPRESHGCGSDILRGLLRQLPRSRGLAWLSETHWTGAYTVVTESYPFDDVENRVDIVVECPSALIFIEVKIDAAEGESQVQRYLRIAERKAGARGQVDAGVVYLTPSWAPGPSVGASDLVVHATWEQVARAVDGVASPANGALTDQLLSQFARHVRQF